MAEEVQQEEVKEVIDGNHHYEMAWATAWCLALQESGLDGLKDASDCQIELPRGGVHTMTQEQEEYSASSSDVMEDGVMSSLLASLQRFMV